MNPFDIQLSQTIYLDRIRKAENCREMFRIGTSYRRTNMISKAIASLSKKVKLPVRLTPSVSAAR